MTVFGEGSDSKMATDNGPCGSAHPRNCQQRIQGGAEARGPGPLPLLKLVKKKMAATWGRKFRESLGPPSDKFLDPLLTVRIKIQMVYEIRVVHTKIQHNYHDSDMAVCRYIKNIVKL